MRLDKFLADMSVGSRKELKQSIRKGCVTIDGAVIRDPGFSVSGTEEVVYRGERIEYREMEYYMLNKPAGVISATEDKKAKTVLDLLGERKRKDLFPVGRLDIDTHGLLLITNDGDLAHRLLSPRHHVDKVYFARVNGIVTEEDRAAFETGLQVDDELTALPAVLEVTGVFPEQGQSEARVTIREGKFHQIKRMFLAVGKEVLYLKRLSMGTLQLDEELPEGGFRELTEQEVIQLKESTSS